DADGARADDQERFRYRLELQDLLVRQDRLAVDLQARKHLRLRPGRNHDVASVHFPRLLALDFEQIRCAQPRAPAYGHDLVLLHQEVGPHRELPDDLVLAGLDELEIQIDVLVEDPELSPVLRLLPKIGIEEQRLRRDATEMKAGAAELRVLFDKSHAQP